MWQSCKRADQSVFQASAEIASSQLTAFPFSRLASGESLTCTCSLDPAVMSRSGDHVQVKVSLNANLEKGNALELAGGGICTSLEERLPECAFSTTAAALTVCCELGTLRLYGQLCCLWMQGACCQYGKASTQCWVLIDNSRGVLTCRAGYTPSLHTQSWVHNQFDCASTYTCCSTCEVFCHVMWHVFCESTHMLSGIYMRQVYVLQTYTCMRLCNVVSCRYIPNERVQYEYPGDYQASDAQSCQADSNLLLHADPYPYPDPYADPYEDSPDSQHSQCPAEQADSHNQVCVRHPCECYKPDHDLLQQPDLKL